MAQQDDNIKRLYEELKNEYDVGSEQDFRNYLDKPENRKALYGELRNEYEINSEKDFDDYLGFGGTSQASIAAQQVVDEYDRSVAENRGQQPTQGGMTDEQKASMSQLAGNFRRNIGDRTQNAISSITRTSNARRSNALRVNRNNIGFDARPYKIGDNPNVAETEGAYNPKTGKVERTYVTETGNEYENRGAADFEQNQIDKERARQLDPINTELREAYAERDRLNARMAELGTELDKRNESRLRQMAEAGNVTGGLYYNQDLFNARDNNEEYLMLHAAANKNDERIRSLEAMRDKATMGTIGTIGRALGNTLLTKDAWDGGANDMVNARAMALSGNVSDERAKEAAQSFLRNYVSAEVASKNEDKTMGDLYTWAKIGGTSAAWAKDFLIGSDLMKGLTKGGAKLGTKAAEKLMLDGWKKAMMKNLGIAAGDVAGATVLATTLQGQNTAADVTKRFMGDVGMDNDGNLRFEGGEGLGTAVRKGLSNAVVENYTERVGEHIPSLKPLIQKGLGKLGLSTVNRWISKVGSTEAYKTMQKWLERSGFNGFGNEVIEEELNIALNAIFVGDQSFSDYLDPKTQADIIGGMALSTAFMGGGSLAAYGIGKAVNTAKYEYIKRKLDDADKVASYRLTQDRWKRLKEEIDGTENDKIPDIVVRIANDKDMSVQEKEAVGNYVFNLLRMRGHNLNETAQAGDTDVLSPAERENVHDDGMIHAVVLYPSAESGEQPQEVFIIKGDIVADANGKVDVEKSSDMITYRGADGQAHITSPDKFQSVAQPVSVEEYVAANTPQESVSQTDNATTIYSPGDEVVLKDENGNAVRGEVMYDANADGQYQVRTESPINGANVNLFTGEELDNLRYEQPSQQENVTDEYSRFVDSGIVSDDIVARIADKIASGQQLTPEEESMRQGAVERVENLLKEKQTGQNGQSVQAEQPIQEAAQQSAQTEQASQPQQTEVSGQGQTALLRIPVDEKGKPAYDKAEPDLAWDAIMEKTDGDEEMAKNVVDAMVKQQEAEVDKLKKKQPKAIPGDVDSMIAAQKEKKAAIAAAEERLEQWRKIADTPNRRAAAANVQPIQNPSDETSTQPAAAIAPTENTGNVEPKTTGNAQTTEQETEVPAGVQGTVEDGAVSEETSAGEEPNIERGRRGDTGDIAGRQQDNLETSEERIRLSDEIDENGYPFVISENGTTTFGEIREDSGLTPAPIKLSEGFQDENGKGYGLTHIEANHGMQIRQAGFRSVKDFVSYVAQNYDEDNIRVGKRRKNGSPTFLIQITDTHDNTLFIEMSKDGSYWNVNSAGIFRKGYSNKKETVAKTEPQQPNNAVSTGSSLSENEEGGITSSEPNGEPTVSSGSKDTQTSANEQTVGEKIAEEEAKVEQNPTEAQKEAGNYKKGHIKIDGYDVTIENPKGSVRSGVDRNGQEWSVTMNNTYGYIRGTEGVDGDHIYVFLSDDPTQGDVYVIDQVNEDGSFDEHKMMYGFNSAEEARDAYLANYSPGWQGLGAITKVSKEEFKKWINSSHRKTKPFAEYKSVNKDGAQNEGNETDEFDKANVPRPAESESPIDYAKRLSEGKPKDKKQKRKADKDLPLTETEYANMRMKELMKDNPQLDEDDAENQALDEYPSYIGEKIKSGELENLYAELPINGKIKLSHIVESAGFDVSDISGKANEERQEEKRRNSHNVGEHITIEFNDGTLVTGEIIKAEDGKITVLSDDNKRKYTVPEKNIIKTNNNDGGVRYRFIGEQGAARLDASEEATTRLDNLDTARQMEQAYNDKKARIEKLRNSKPVEITGEEYKDKYDLNRDSAKKWLKNNLRGKYKIDDTNETIVIGRKGVNKVTSHSMGNKAHLRSLVAVPEMLKKAIFITEESAEKENAQYPKYRYYVVGLKIGDADYTVKITIGVDENGKKYYDHALTEIEKGTLIDNIDALSTTSDNNQNAENGFISTGAEPNPSVAIGKDTKLQSILQTNDQENARKIKLATGWERGADGKWRYETPDFEYHPNGDARQNDKYKESDWYKELYDLEERLFNGETLTDEETRRFDELSARENEIRDNDKNTEHVYLDDYVKDDEMFKAYPELKQTKVDFVDLPSAEYSAKYNPEENRITVNQAKSIDIKSVLAHEIQHAIQRIEGFASGGNSRNGQYNNLSGEVEARNVQERLNMTPEQRRKTLAEETEDVAREDQQFLQDAIGTSESLATTEQANDIDTAVADTAGKLNIGVRVAHSVDEVGDEGVRRAIDNGRNVKGWYDTRTGEIVVYAPNATDVDDAVRTVLHEGVAHYGLRQLVGEENFDTFLDNIYNNVDGEIKAAIDEKAQRNGWSTRVATEEYLASLAEDTNFEEARSNGLWQKIKDFFMELLTKAGVRLNEALTDNELRYILWRSYENLQEPNGRGTIGTVRDVAMQGRLGVGNYEDTDVRLRETEDAQAHESQGTAQENDEGTTPTSAYIVDAWDKQVKSDRFKLVETGIDYLNAVDKFQKLIAKHSGKEIKSFENAYDAMTFLSSKNREEMDMFESFFVTPLNKAIQKLIGEKGGLKKWDWSKGALRELVMYVEAKHGTERNRQMAVEAVAKADEKNSEAILNDWAAAKKRINEHEGTSWQEKQRLLDEAAASLGADLSKDYSGLSSVFGDKNAYPKGWQEESLDYVSKYESGHEAEDINGLWTAIGNATGFALQKQYETGLVSREYVERQKERFDNYIPLRGFEDEIAGDVYSYLGHDFYPGSNPVKTAHGRTSEPGNPFGSILNTAYASISSGNKNVAKTALYSLVVNHDTGGLAVAKRAWMVKYADLKNNPELESVVVSPKIEGDEDIPEWVEAVPRIQSGASAEDINRMLGNFEEVMKKYQKEDVTKPIGKKVKIAYKTLYNERNEHDIPLFIAGDKYIITITGNPRVAQAMNGLLNPDSGEENTLTEYAKKTQRFMSGAFTAKNAAFSFANLAKDTIYANNQAFIRENPKYWLKFTENQRLGFGDFIPMMRRLKRYRDGKLDLTKKRDRMFKEFMENGGATGYTFVNTQEEYAKELAKKLDELSRKIPKALSFKGLWNIVFDTVEFMGQAAELVNRFAAYKTSREMGPTVNRSIRDAKEITVNFNRKGAGRKTADKNNKWYINLVAATSQYGRTSILFWNANMQAKYRFFKNIQEHPIKTSVTLIANCMAIGGAIIPFINNLALPALYEMFGIGGDDDDDDYYNALTDWERTHNICLRLPKGYWLKIPLSPEMTPWYSMGDAIGGAASGQRDLSAKDFMKSAIDAVSPLSINWSYSGSQMLLNALPTVGQPLFQNMMNVNFMGNPIKKTPFTR